jgi:hypothetical protein
VAEKREAQDGHGAKGRWRWLPRRGRGAAGG